MRERELKPGNTHRERVKRASLPMRERELKRQDVGNDRTR